ncbi:MAG: S1 RNA-binding domain-containing protein [Candidatus Pacebacteria bacterium]|nr:S1 RNA-binding domain-containing protein [Candidatus Paceibacterota bacterium]
MPILKKNNSISLPLTGSLVEGIVLEKKERSLFIDLSPYGTGVVEGAEYSEARHYIKTLSLGEKALVRILDWNNEKGLIDLSLENLERKKSWENIKEFKDNNETLSFLILEANTGGLIGKVEDIKGFLPASQLAADHYPKVEEGKKAEILEKLKSLIGQEIKVKVLDCDSTDNKLILSEKLVEKDKIKDIINKYNKGDVVKATITKIVDFGAFAKLDDTGVDGLIHSSEIADPLPENINEVLKEGEKKDVKIIAIENNRISLSLKNIKKTDQAEK